MLLQLYIWRIHWWPPSCTRRQVSVSVSCSSWQSWYNFWACWSNTTCSSTLESATSTDCRWTSSSCCHFIWRVTGGTETGLV